MHYNISQNERCALSFTWMQRAWIGKSSIILLKTIYYNILSSSFNPFNLDTEPPGLSIKSLELEDESLEDVLVRSFI
jgi:hypothetical protein